MKYRKDFEPEHLWLLKNGFPEKDIESFYLDAALDILRSNDRHKEHNLPMYGKPDAEDGCQSDAIVYRRGSVRKKSDAEKEDQTGWCWMKLCVTPLYCEDVMDVYLESVSVLEQVGDEELNLAISHLTERQQLILELLVDEWSQTKIAAHLGVSCAAVSKQVHTIRKALEPYYSEYHWLKLK